LLHLTVETCTAVTARNLEEKIQTEILINHGKAWELTRGRNASYIFVILLIHRAVKETTQITSSQLIRGLGTQHRHGETSMSLDKQRNGTM